jgi:biopolymer transport protein ExbB/TolQ
VIPQTHHHDMLVEILMALLLVFLIGGWAVTYAAMLGYRTVYNRGLAHTRRADQRADSERDLREDYERALALPFYDRSQTEQAIMARAAAGDPIASALLNDRLHRAFDQALTSAAVSS